MLGSHVTERLFDAGARVTVAARTPRSRLRGHLVHRDRIDYRFGDLREAPFARECTRAQEVVLHFASKIAGLGYNDRHSAEMMTYNTILDLQVLDASARSGVARFFYPSGALVYDEDAHVPVGEGGSTAGAPVRACRGASWAKRTVEKALALYAEETGMRAVVARLSNVYGPGDDFSEETAHLIGNLIRLIANDRPPEIWGDGSQLRCYLFVEDAVEAILGLVGLESDLGPVNIGGRHEHSVGEIVEMLLAVSGKPLRPVYRQGSPLGLDRKLLDTSRFRSLTGFEETVALKDGLARTYRWYLERHGLEGR
jgi:GDP-L-fucose synthase